ncbi:MAG: DUF445 family protein [Nanoarchaeales archaeon]|nr:DUF445 family protein [Nanoarchaeales archaeon]
MSKEIIILSMIPVVSAGLGWFTNWVAIRSLFRPYKLINVLGFKFVGVIPKRKNILARKIAEVVDEYFISHKDIGAAFSEPENIEKIKKRVIPIISTKILDNVPVMMKMIAEPIIKNVLEKEADDIILKIGDELVGHMEENFDIKQIVEKKILSYDTRNVEKIILKVAKKEFTHIEYLGAVIGFVVGLFQVVLFLVL